MVQTASGREKLKRLLLKLKDVPEVHVDVHEISAADKSSKIRR